MFSWLKRKSKKSENIDIEFIVTAEVDIPFEVAKQYPMERITDILALEIGRRIMKDREVKSYIDDITLKTKYSVEAKFIGEGGIK